MITGLAIFAAVTTVIQLNAGKRAHGLPVAEQKVHMLAVDFVGVAAPVAAIFDLGIEEIAERDFGADANLWVNHSGKHAVETQLGRREKVVAQRVGIDFFVRGGRLVGREEVDNAIDDLIDCFLR
ncbi:MAG: hypothetical protein M9936_32070 [Caldilinea sp.]|nr:hypothetical protein [Caldilinea sp.]